MIKIVSISLTIMIIVIWILDVFFINPKNTLSHKYNKNLEIPRYIISTKYVEPYSTWIKKDCNSSIEVKGSGFDIKNDNLDDCSKCEFHEGSYYIIDEKAEYRKINKTQYLFIKNIWKNETKINMNRNIIYNEGCGMNGDMYLIRPNNKIKLLVKTIIK